jgi:uncharacterized phosphosugar-binding protein
MATPHIASFVEKYALAVSELLERVQRQEKSRVIEGGGIIADAVADGGVVHIFGAGHSQLVAADGTFRAGGAAWVNGILDPALSIGRGALASTATERIAEMADGIFSQVEPSERDVTIVVTNSGVTPISVRWAELAKARGLRVISLTSHASMSYFGEMGQPDLAQWSDLLIDNHTPVGDVALAGPEAESSFGPLSTIVNSFLSHWLTVAAHEVLQSRGREVEAFKSGHLPDAAQHNEVLIGRYKARIDIL